MSPSWFYREFGLRDSGSDVNVVQRRLGAPFTGVFDEETEVRVRGLQRLYGLRETGVVNAGTARRIGERARVGMTPDWHVRTICLGDEGEDARRARATLGLGDADNRWDAAAEAACRRWQSAHGLDPTGEFDATTAVTAGAE